jgi:hypothetical protein
MAGGDPSRPAEDSIQCSLNAPVPGAVARVASDLRPALAPFESVRERHTLVCKRLGAGAPDVLEKEVRRALAGAPAFEARVAGLGAFPEPAAGPGPVVYLAVESPGLVRLHRELCASFEPVPGIEGDDYVPHVTLARGGGADAAEAERLVGTDVEQVTWTVNELVLWDARYDEVTGRVSLPA